MGATNMGEWTQPLAGLFALDRHRSQKYIANPRVAVCSLEFPLFDSIMRAISSRLSILIANFLVGGGPPVRV
jgi:hypothetical protein